MKRALKKKVILYSVIAIILVIALIAFLSLREREILFEPHCDENFHDCGVLDDPGKVYCISGTYGELRVNNAGLPLTKECIKITANNVKLWCLNDARITADDSIKNNSLAVAISAENVRNLEIRNCIINGWNNTGIKLTGVSDSKIVEVEIRNSGKGIFLNKTNKTDIISPSIIQNIEGILLSASNENKIIGENGEGIMQNIHYGISINNSLSETSQSNSIVNLTIRDNPIGILFSNNANNSLVDNCLINNNLFGIRFISSSRNTIINSRIENSLKNSVGLSLDSFSIENTFYNNLFRNFNNLDPALPWAIINQNIWDTAKSKKTNIVGGLFSGGNYWGDNDNYGWSDFEADCNDITKDGVCDNAYLTQTGEIIDSYPLSRYILSDFYASGGCNEYIDSCKGSVNWDDDYIYCLNESLNSTSGNCLDIQKNKVTIDCKSHAIDGSKNYGGNGIYLSSREGVIIKNCIIKNFNSSSAKGIYSSSSNNLLIYNSTLLNNFYGLNIASQTNTSLNKLSFINNTLFGIASSFLGQNNISEIIFDGNNNSALNFPPYSSGIISNIIIQNSKNSSIALNIYGLTNGIIKNIVLNNNAGSGLLFNHFLNSNISNITSQNNQFGAFSIHNSKNNSFSNFVSINDGSGIYVKNSHNNSFYNMNITNSKNNSIPAFWFIESHMNKLINLKAENNNNTGFYFNNSYRTNATNLISRNNQVGIVLSNSQNNNFSSLDISNNKENEIKIINSQNNKLFDSRVIKNNNQSGVYLEGSSNNLFFNNYFNLNVNISDNQINFWNTTYNSSLANIYGTQGYGGNIWTNSTGGYSDSCTNIGNDNICDFSYNLTSDGANKDELVIAKHQTTQNCNNISSCYAGFQSNNLYCLNQTIDASSGTCFNIGVQNITIDCRGNKIEGNSTELTALAISASGIIIQNCIIQNFTEPIKINSDNNLLSGITILNSKQDAITLSGQNNSILSSSITGTNNSFYDLVSTGQTNIKDTYIERFNFTSDTIKITKTNQGEVKFLEPISATGILKDEVKFANNLVYVNSLNSGLNKSANITLYNSAGGQNNLLLRNGVVCNSTTSPSCNLFSNLNSSPLFFRTSNAGNFSIISSGLRVIEPNAEKKTSSNYIYFSFIVSYPAGGNISNCTLMIDDSIEKVFGSNEIKNNEEEDYRYNIPSEGVYDWNFTCIDSNNNLLQDSGWFNKTYSSSSAPSAQTCSQKSGIICNSNYSCSTGSFVTSSNSARCCLGTCVLNVARNCSQISGARICSPAQSCSGVWLNTLDTSRCCSGSCIDIEPTQSCAQKSGFICNSTQSCSTGSFVTSSNSARCCLGTCDTITPPLADCGLGCKINNFFGNKKNLVIALSIIGAIIVLIVVIFLYSFKNKNKSEKIRMFQDPQKPNFGLQSQYNPVANLKQQTMNAKPISAPIVQSKQDEEVKKKADVVNIARLSLRNYILKELRRGVSEQDIKDVLSKANWKENEISLAISDVKKFMEKGN